MAKVLFLFDFFLHTFGTSSVDGQVVVCHPEPVPLADLRFHLFPRRNGRDVDDRVAAGANEVRVVAGVCVKPLVPVHNTYAADQPLLPEQSQVAVHRSQTQILMLRFKGLIEPFRCGVALGRPESRQDGFPLFTVSRGTFHIGLLNSNNSCLQDDNTTPPSVCKEVFQKNQMGVKINF